MKRFLIYTLMAIAAWACSKENDDIIPDISFNAQVNLDLPQYNSNPFIIRPGGLNPRVGINGVVVFKISTYECYAFDLMCTHDAHDTPGYHFTALTEEGSVTMECPECGSQFSIAAEYGAVIKGPAKWALKRYQSNVSGSVLRIWN